MKSSILNIFYEEPDPDRWLPFDRYPRKFIRELLRGKPRPGGVMMVALELMKGLDRIGVQYRFNDYNYIDNHPDEIACIIGKPHLLFKRKWKNTIVFGAGVFSHPIEHQDLLVKMPNIKKILVPGNWMKEMFEPFYPGKVISWPVGIDTSKWQDLTNKNKEFDFLIYNKIRWNQSAMNNELVEPIKEYLIQHNYSFNEIVYGHYNHADLYEKLKKSKAVIFLCEHETQGIAYQQILATNTPIFAWDRGGYWEDPAYFPERVKYKPVSSVPYWDKRCGEKFKDYIEFKNKLVTFILNYKNNEFNSREYIIENLTLEKSATEYLNIINSINQNPE
jgi:hypothetical protein